MFSEDFGPPLEKFRVELCLTIYRARDYLTEIFPRQFQETTVGSRPYCCVPFAWHDDADFSEIHPSRQDGENFPVFISDRHLSRLDEEHIRTWNSRKSFTTEVLEKHSRRLWSQSGQYFCEGPQITLPPSSAFPSSPGLKKAARKVFNRFPSGLETRT